MALVNNVNEAILDQLGTMEPVEQAKLDMRLHAQALMDDSGRFGSRDEKFLSEDMGTKQSFIKLMQKGGTFDEKAKVAKRLLRDKAIHEKYLSMPEMQGRGSHRWHQTWMGVYDGWLNHLGQKERKTKLPAGMPPPPPPELTGEWAAFDEQEAYQGQADAGAVYDWSQPIPEYNYYPEPVNISQDYSSYDPNATTDQAITQVDSFGNYYNPQTGYVTSPEGNQYVDGQWQSNDGTMVLSDAGWVPNAPADVAGPEDIQSGIIANDPNAYDPMYAANPDIYAPDPIDGVVRDYASYDPNPDTSAQRPVGETRANLVAEERQKLVDQYAGQDYSAYDPNSTNPQQAAVAKAIQAGDEEMLTRIAEANVDTNFAKDEATREIAAARTRVSEELKANITQVASQATDYVSQRLMEAGYIKDADGKWTGESDKDFQTVIDEALLAFDSEFIDPLRAEAMAKLQTEGQIINSRANWAAGESERQYAEMLDAEKDSWNRFSLQSLLHTAKNNIANVADVTAPAFNAIVGSNISVGIPLPFGGEYTITSPSLADAFEKYGIASDWWTDQFISGVDYIQQDEALSLVVNLMEQQSAGVKSATYPIKIIEALYDSGTISHGTRHFIYSWIADPTNAIPGIGVADMNEFRAVATGAKIAFGDSLTKADDFTRLVLKTLPGDAHSYAAGMGGIGDTGGKIVREALSADPQKALDEAAKQLDSAKSFLNNPPDDPDMLKRYENFLEQAQKTYDDALRIATVGQVDNAGMELLQASDAGTLTDAQRASYRKIAEDNGVENFNQKTLEDVVTELRGRIASPVASVEDPVIDEIIADVQDAVRHAKSSAGSVTEDSWHINNLRKALEDGDQTKIDDAIGLINREIDGGVTPVVIEKINTRKTTGGLKTIGKEQNFDSAADAARTAKLTADPTTPGFVPYELSARAQKILDVYEKNPKLLSKLSLANIRSEAIDAGILVKGKTKEQILAELKAFRDGNYTPEEYQAALRIRSLFTKNISGRFSKVATEEPLAKLLPNEPWVRAPKFKGEKNEFKAPAGLKKAPKDMTPQDIADAEKWVEKVLEGRKDDIPARDAAHAINQRLKDMPKPQSTARGVGQSEARGVSEVYDTSKMDNYDGRLRPSDREGLFDETSADDLITAANNTAKAVLDLPPHSPEAWGQLIDAQDVRTDLEILSRRITDPAAKKQVDDAIEHINEALLAKEDELTIDMTGDVSKVTAAEAARTAGMTEKQVYAARKQFVAMVNDDAKLAERLAELTNEQFTAITASMQKPQWKATRDKLIEARKSSVKSDIAGLKQDSAGWNKFPWMQNKPAAPVGSESPNQFASDFLKKYGEDRRIQMREFGARQDNRPMSSLDDQDVSKLEANAPKRPMGTDTPFENAPFKRNVPEPAKVDENDVNSFAREFLARQERQRQIAMQKPKAPDTRPMSSLDDADLARLDYERAHHGVLPDGKPFENAPWRREDAQKVAADRVEASEALNDLHNVMETSGKKSNGLVGDFISDAVKLDLDEGTLNILKVSVDALEEDDYALLIEDLVAKRGVGEEVYQIAGQLREAAANAKAQDKLNSMAYALSQRAGHDVPAESLKFGGLTEPQLGEWLTNIFQRDEISKLAGVEISVVKGVDRYVVDVRGVGKFVGEDLDEVARVMVGRTGVDPVTKANPFNFVENTGGPNPLHDFKGSPVGKPNAGFFPISRDVNGSMRNPAIPLSDLRSGTDNAVVPGQVTVNGRRGVQALTPEDVLKAEGVDSKPLSHTELLRKWAGENINLPLMRLSQNRLFQVREEMPILMQQFRLAQEASLQMKGVVNKTIDDSLAAAGVRHKAGGKLDVGIGRDITVAELFNRTPDNLPPQLAEAVTKIKDEITYYIDTLYKEYSFTEDDLFKQVGLKHGEFVPEIVGKDKRAPFRNMTDSKGQREATDQAYPMKKPELIVGDIVHALRNETDVRWWNEASNALHLDDTKTATLGDLKFKITATETKVAALEGVVKVNATDEALQDLADAQHILSDLKAQESEFVASTKQKYAHIFGVVDSLNNNMRALNATGDFSFLGVTGMLGLFTDPRATYEGLKLVLSHGLDAFGGIGHATRADFMLKHWDAVVDGIDNGLFVGNAAHLGLSTPGLHKVGLKGFRPFAFFDDVFSDFTNARRIMSYETVQDIAALSGKNLSVAERRAYAETINKINGVGKQIVTGNAVIDYGLNFVTFAPRFLQSQIGILADFFTKDITNDKLGTAMSLIPLRDSYTVSRGLQKGTAVLPTPGDMARNALATMMMVGVSGTIGLNVALGNDFDYFSPWLKDDDGNWYPNPNFMRIRVGGDDYSVFGPWDTLFKLGSISALTGNKIFNDAVNGKPYTLPKHLLGLAGVFEQYKGSPVAKWFLEVTGAIEPLSKEFRGHTALDGIGRSLGVKGLTDTLLNQGQRFAPFFGNTLMHEGFDKPLSIFASFNGGKVSPMTPKERLMQDTNGYLNDTYKSVKSNYPDMPDSKAKLVATEIMENSPEYQAAYKRYIDEEVARGSDWAKDIQKRIIIKDELRITNGQTDAELKSWWESEGKARFENRNQSLKQIEDELFGIFGSREAAERIIDQYYKDREALSGQLGAAPSRAGVENISSQIDKTKNGLAPIAAEMKALRDQAYLNGTKYTEGIAGDKYRALQAQYDAVYASLTPLYDAAKAESARLSDIYDARGNIYDQIKNLSLQIDSLKNELDHSRAASDPRLQELLDLRNLLELQQRLDERKITEWQDQIQANKDFSRGRLYETYGEFTGNPSDMSEVIKAKIYETVNKEAYKQGNIPTGAWDEINFELSMYRSTLSPEDQVLFDIISTPEPKYGASLEYDIKKNSLNPVDGTFYGKDIRQFKPEDNLYSASMLAVPGFSNGDWGNEYHEFNTVTKSTQILDQAEQAIFAGDAETASRTLAQIADASGGDPGALAAQFRAMVTSDARGDAALPSTYENTLRDVTETSIRTYMNSYDPETPVPPPGPPPGQAQYEAGQAARAEGAAASASGLPRPDGAPDLAEGMVYPKEIEAPKDVMDFFTDRMKSEFFGYRVDPLTGVVTSMGLIDLAPTRPETWSYLYSKNLDNVASVTEHAKQLIEMHKDNPQVQLLLLADPSVRLSLIGGGNYTPAPRNYLLAIDKVLRVLDGEEVMTPEQAVAGYTDSMGDRYFSVFNPASLPAVMKLDQQLEALYNNTKLAEVSTQIGLNTSNVKYTWDMFKANMLTAEQRDNELARLDAERLSLVQVKQQLSEANSAKIEALKEERNALINAKPLPGDEIFNYLLEKQASEKDEIFKAVNELIIQNGQDPRVMNIIAVASGKEMPLPELAAWMQMRTAEWAETNARLASLGQPILAPEQQVLKELMDVAALMEDRGTYNPSASRMIVAGSAVLAAVGNEPANIRGGFNMDTGEMIIGHGTAEGTHGGGVTQPSPTQAPMPSQPQQQFSQTAMPAAPRTPVSQTSFGSSSMPTPPRTTTQPKTSSYVPTTPRPSTVTSNKPAEPKQPELQYATKSWPEFKSTAISIFGDQRMLVVMEKAFGQGRAITDPKTLRQLRFIWKLAPITGATSFDGWMAALRLMYGGVQVAATGRGYQQREIRTNFERV